MSSRRPFKLISSASSQFRSRLAQCRTAEQAVALMNERFFIITVGLAAKVVVGEERHDLGEPPRLYPFAEFKKLFLPYVFTYRDKTFDVGTVFVRHAKRRAFDGQLVFRPDGSPFSWNRADDYNLWRGLAVRPKKGNWSLLKAHILQNLCNNNDEYLEYLLNWMAHLVQYPGRLPGVAVCLHGGQGTGKGTFFQCLASLFPRDHVMQVTKPEHLVGRFNAHLSAKVLVFADEAFFAGDKKILGELNAIITERQRGVERKGIDVTTEENCVHLVMASNNKWFLHASKDARRYFVLNVQDTHAQDTAYFDALLAQQDAGGREAMLYDLQRRDLSKFNPFHVPKTEGLEDQITLSSEGHEAWWKERLTDTTPDKWPEMVNKRKLHRSYLDWMRDHQRRHPITREQLSKYFVEKYGPSVLHRHRESGDREYVYRFPPLDESRRKFDPKWPILRVLRRSRRKAR